MKDNEQQLKTTLRRGITVVMSCYPLSLSTHKNGKWALQVCKSPKTTGSEHQRPSIRPKQREVSIDGCQFVQDNGKWTSTVVNFSKTTGSERRRPSIRPRQREVNVDSRQFVQDSGKWTFPAGNSSKTTGSEHRWRPLVQGGLSGRGGEAGRREIGYVQICCSV